MQVTRPVEHINFDKMATEVECLVTVPVLASEIM